MWYLDKRVLCHCDQLFMSKSILSVFFLLYFTTFRYDQEALGETFCAMSSSSCLIQRLQQENSLEEHFMVKLYNEAALQYKLNSEFKDHNLP